jgi:cleavage and polyadenylation specificity factor subunit 3
MSVITQRKTIPIGVDWSVVQWYLEGMYGEAEDGVDAEGRRTSTVSRRLQQG